MHWVRFFVACLLLAACSGSSNPATTPAFIPTTTSTTTTTLAPTTTLDRLAEIEAIYQDLEQSRIDALYREDREGYRALFSNEAFAETSMVVFDALDFDLPPVVEVEVLRVLADGAECIAVERVLYRADLGVSSDPGIEILELRDGLWLISYVGDGWICDGPHPFDT